MKVNIENQFFQVILWVPKRLKGLTTIKFYKCAYNSSIAHFVFEDANVASHLTMMSGITCHFRLTLELAAQLTM